jgi:7-carboxy-7-deazaguanine synthase
MKVTEIFYSLQGEGLLSGLPTIFIRTTGCNLRCSYCDTTYAYTGGKAMTIDEILRELEHYPTHYCCVTGGEPLQQPDLQTMVSALVVNGYRVSIETNGSLPIQPFTQTEDVMVSLDIKCPSSGMQERMDLGNLRLLRDIDQLKFIISDRQDYDYAKDLLLRHRPRCEIFFQPVWGTDTTKLAGWILSDGLHVRLGIQLQKYLWGTQRGK